MWPPAHRGRVGHAGKAVEGVNGVKLCDRCRVGGCCLNYLGEACKRARKRECPDVEYTNADRIREMSDNDLSRLLIKVYWAGIWGGDFKDTFKWGFDWLRKPAEED